MSNDNIFRECRNCAYFDRGKVYCKKKDCDVNPTIKCNDHITEIELMAKRYVMRNIRITEEVAWIVYNFINEWKDGEYGLIPLSEALDIYFNGGEGE